MGLPYYTGIGSRRAPEDELKKMRYLGRVLAQAGFVLRSGAADGSDTAFEQGCDKAGGAKDIFIAWRGFSRRYDLKFKEISQEAMELAATLHPGWNYLKQGAKLLHGRNTYQVLGESLDEPSEFTVCWTPDGAETIEQLTAKTGGTSTAIRLSLLRDIPVFNLKNPDSVERFKLFIRENYPSVKGI